MSFELLNPWMLAGLAGVALPVLAHLLSKKKFDIVSWGAMQFLEMGQETRRRIWLDDLWLLLLRMGLIAWLAFALGRPWISATWLGDIGPQPNRDLVLIVDSSYSMAWEATSVTPQQAAARWAEKFLSDLRPGDTVAVLEAREGVRALIEPGTRDLNRVREVLRALPPPTSAANLPEAFAHAIKLLSHGTHGRREIVLLTDGQAHGWFSDDAGLWLRVDDLAKQSSVAPQLWVVDVLKSDEEAAAPTERLNFHVERLQVTRELTVPSFPIRFQTKVRYSGGSASVTRQVHFEVDGQRLADRTISVSLAPGGEANVEFEHRFETLGSHLVKVTLDADDLPTDNSSEAVINVTDALPVLIVDGDPHAEAVQGETFFLRAALSATGNETPWVKPTVVTWNQWTPQPPASLPAEGVPPPKIPPPKIPPPRRSDLDPFAAVVLANVPQLSVDQMAVLTDYVRRGGGLAISLGNRVEKEKYATSVFNSANGLLGLTLNAIESETAEQREEGVLLANATLESPWLQRFRAERGAAFTTSRFSRWWKVEVDREAEVEAVAVANEVNVPKEQDGVASSAVERKRPIVLARLTTGAPYLVFGQFGRGNVLLLTAPLDADWSTMPAKPDYVAFVHEMLFQLASRRGDRNVPVGQPLMIPLALETKIEDFVFEGPDGEPRVPKLSGDEQSPLAMLDDTSLPGVYVFRQRGAADQPRRADNKEVDAKIPASGKAREPKPVVLTPKLAVIGAARELFVVNADRAESNLTPLTDEQIAALSANDRLQFVRESRDIRLAASKELPRHELWQLFLLGFLGLLIFEVLMTRRLVREGHATAGLDTND